MTWHARGLEVIRAVPKGTEFTAEDLRDWIGDPDPDGTPNGANNAIGSLFREASAAGLIEPTGRYVKSRSPRRKGGVVQIWERTTVDDQLALF